MSLASPVLQCLPLLVMALLRPDVQAPTEPPSGLFELQRPAFMLVKDLKIEAGEDRLQSLLKQRHNALFAALDSRYKEWVAGRGTLPFLIREAEDFRRVRLELCSDDKERLAVLQEFVDWAKAVERLTRKRFDQEKVATQDLKDTEVLLYDAQIEYLRAQRRSNKP